MLGNIPGIGRLFSTTTGNVNNTETIVIITPRIVPNPGKSDEISQKMVEQANHNLGLILEQERKLRSLDVIDKLDTSDPR